MKDSKINIWTFIHPITSEKKKTYMSEQMFTFSIWWAGLLLALNTLYAWHVIINYGFNDFYCGYHAVRIGIRSKWMQFQKNEWECSFNACVHRCASPLPIWLKWNHTNETQSGQSIKWLNWANHFCSGQIKHTDTIRRDRSSERAEIKCVRKMRTNHSEILLQKSKLIIYSVCYSRTNGI